MKLYNTKQQGVVLFLALIALVVMSLAAVALIRSVDTNTIIAGNLALKHSALVSSDRGLESALNWLEANKPTSNNPNSLNNHSAVNGYYATYLTLDLSNADILKSDATWAAGVSGAAVGAGIAGGVEASSGNEIRYIIQRMCRETASPAVDKCLFGDSEIGSGSFAVKDANEAGASIAASQSPIYRITTRVAGVKNTFVYTQAFVY